MRLYQQGHTQYRIAKRLGVSFEAVSNWVEAYQDQGMFGLKTKGQPGPEAQLTTDDRRQLKAAILQGPHAFGYATDIWTLERIAAVIRKLTNASFKTTQTWRIVTSLGFSCQKPATRAKERNEATIRAWKLTKLPRLKKMGSYTSVLARFSR